MIIDHFYKLMTVFTKEGMLRIGRDDFLMNCRDILICGSERFEEWENGFMLSMHFQTNRTRNDMDSFIN